MRVYHNKRAWSHYELDGVTYLFPYNDPYHVFSLTDTWGYNGRPAQYGALPLWDKIRSLEDRDRAFREVFESEEKSREAQARTDKNLAEDMALEMRDAVKIDTKDTLLHSTDMKKDKRRLYEKRRS